MKSVRLPPIQSIIDLHSEWIAEFGGAPGLRDRGALEASLARAHQVMAYEADLGFAEIAAAVCASIIRNHPFIDGNKRAAFGTLGVVLGLNGLYLDVSESEATRAILALTTREMSEDAFRHWVSSNTISDEDIGG